MTAGGGRKVSPVIADSSDCNVPARDSQADDFLPVQVILALASPDQTFCSTTCYDGNFTPLDPLWGQLTSPGGKLLSATCQDGNLLQSSASEFSCPRGPSGGLVHLLRWELPPNLSHLPSEKSFQHQPLKIKRIDLVLKTVN